MFCVTQAETSLKIDKMFEFNIGPYRKFETFYKSMPPPCLIKMCFKHSCLFVNDIKYQNAMFWQEGGGCQKKKKKR